MSPDFEHEIPIDFGEEVPHELELQLYEQEVIDQIRRQTKLDNPITQRLKIVEFTSRSAGRGKKRRSRQIQLLVVDDSYAYIIKRGEVKAQKYRNHHIDPDVLANEILRDFPQDERTVDKLLEILNSIR
jgi:hypothetical protein